MVSNVFGELLMVSRTTAHSVNPGEKANLPIKEFPSSKEEMIHYMRQLLKCPNILP